MKECLKVVPMHWWFTALIVNHFFFLLLSQTGCFHILQLEGTCSLSSRQNIFVGKMSWDSKKKKKFCKFNCHSTGCGRNTSYIRQVVEDTITTILLLCGRYCCCTLYKRLKRLSYNYYLTVHNTYSLVPNNCQNQVSFCTNIFFFKFPC